LIGNLIYDKSEIKNAKTEKQKEDLARRKAYLETIDNEAKLIRLSSKKVENLPLDSIIVFSRFSLLNTKKHIFKF
jgi:hypothetical protein